LPTYSTEQANDVAARIAKHRKQLAKDAAAKGAAQQTTKGAGIVKDIWKIAKVKPEQHMGDFCDLVESMAKLKSDVFMRAKKELRTSTRARVKHNELLHVKSCGYMKGMLTLVLGGSKRLELSVTEISHSLDFDEEKNQNAAAATAQKTADSSSSSAVNSAMVNIQHQKQTAPKHTWGNLEEPKRHMVLWGASRSAKHSWDAAQRTSSGVAMVKMIVNFCGAVDDVAKNGGRVSMTAIKAFDTVKKNELLHVTKCEHSLVLGVDMLTVDLEGKGGDFVVPVKNVLTYVDFGAKKLSGTCKPLQAFTPAGHGGPLAVS
jgi:hypothetical protein